MAAGAAFLDRVHAARWRCAGRHRPIVTASAPLLEARSRWLGRGECR